MRFSLVLVLTICASAIVGCQKSLPATVSGTVTLDGEPLPEGPNYAGTIVLYPTAGGAAAYGQITKGGHYEVQTGTTQGLAPGDYKVTVRLVEIEPEPPGGYVNAPAQKLISPKRYNDRELTDLTKSIAEGANTIDLDLTSKP